MSPLQWCAPGDRQEDAWLIRFDDSDRGDALYTGPDAEAQARKAWELMCGPSGTWNGYLFRLTRAAEGPSDETVERVAIAICQKLFPGPASDWPYQGREIEMRERALSAARAAISALTQNAKDTK